MLKYIPQSTIWSSRRLVRCTPFWRGILSLRDTLKPHLKWIIGNGQSCPVFSSPWFPGGTELTLRNQQQRRLLVASLFTPSQTNFDVQKLQATLGLVNARAVLWEFRFATLHPSIPDKLVFTYTTDGNLTVKTAFRLLTQLHSHSISNHSSLAPTFWKKFWASKFVPPRVLLFIWKAIRGALPVRQSLHNRLPHIPADCPLCGADSETPYHLLFQCPHARATWFHSSLGIRTDEISGLEVGQAFQHMWQNLDNPQIMITMLISWQIWKSRCFKKNSGTEPSPEETLRQVASLADLSDVAGLLRHHPPTPVVAHLLASRPVVTTTPLCCWVDVSFQSPDSGGTGYILHEAGILVQYGGEGHPCALSAFHMEGLSLLRANLAHVISLSRFCLLFFAKGVQSTGSPYCQSGQDPSVYVYWIHLPSLCFLTCYDRTGYLAVSLPDSMNFGCFLWCSLFFVTLNQGAPGCVHMFCLPCKSLTVLCSICMPCKTILVLIYAYGLQPKKKITFDLLTCQ